MAMKSTGLHHLFMVQALQQQSHLIYSRVRKARSSGGKSMHWTWPSTVSSWFSADKCVSGPAPTRELIRCWQPFRRWLQLAVLLSREAPAQSALLQSSAERGKAVGGCLPAGYVQEVWKHLDELTGKCTSSGKKQRCSWPLWTIQQLGNKT